MPWPEAALVAVSSAFLSTYKWLGDDLIDLGFRDQGQTAGLGCRILRVLGLGLECCLRVMAMVLGFAV